MRRTFCSVQINWPRSKFSSLPLPANVKLNWHISYSNQTCRGARGYIKINVFTNTVVTRAYTRLMETTDSNTTSRRTITIRIEAHPLKKKKHLARKIKKACVKPTVTAVTYWFSDYTEVNYCSTSAADLFVSLSATYWDRRTDVTVTRLNRISRGASREKTKIDRRNTRCCLDVSWDRKDLIGSVAAACVRAPDGSPTEKEGTEDRRVGPHCGKPARTRS